MTQTPVVPVLLILAGLAVLALLWRYIDGRGPRAASVRLEQLPALLERAQRSLAEAGEMRTDTEHAIQTALESFGLAFHLSRGAEVMPFPIAVQTRVRRGA